MEFYDTICRLSFTLQLSKLNGKTTNIDWQQRYVHCSITKLKLFVSQNRKV